VADAAPSTPRIRATTPGDADRIADIYVAMARHHAALDPAEFRVPEHAAVVTRFRAELEAAEDVDLHLVAEVDGLVVGQLDAFMRPQPSQGSMRTPRRSALIGVSVDEGWRGRGIGTALMHAAEAWARERGFDALELDVADPNRDARLLYERLGYGLVAHTLVKPLDGKRASGGASAGS
jgi:ribosomal protein S18 acetylase RimI-like enzyme